MRVDLRAAVLPRCSENLKADEGAEYDQLIEINLNELEPHVNGPFTPDLAHPLSKFADAIRANGWPSELKVRHRQHQLRHRLLCSVVAVQKERLQTMLQSLLLPVMFVW